MIKLMHRLHCYMILEMRGPTNNPAGKMHHLLGFAIFHHSLDTGHLMLVAQDQVLDGLPHVIVKLCFMSSLRKL